MPHTYTVQCFHSYAQATNTLRRADRFPAERGINSNLDRLRSTKHFYREKLRGKALNERADLEEKVSASVLMGFGMSEI